MGAWIETLPIPDKDGIGKVAPLVGAWIETMSEYALSVKEWSHPSWVRGLKPDSRYYGGSLLRVAPLVGAWIETHWLSTPCYYLPSHPSWVRGLKHAIELVGHLLGVSHPSWVRGLKHKDRTLIISARCRTPRGCVD